MSATLLLLGGAAVLVGIMGTHAARQMRAGGEPGSMTLPVSVHHYRDGRWWWYTTPSIAGVLDLVGDRVELREEGHVVFSSPARDCTVRGPQVGPAALLLTRVPLEISGPFGRVALCPGEAPRRLARAPRDARRHSESLALAGRIEAALRAAGAGGTGALTPRSGRPR